MPTCGPSGGHGGQEFNDEPLLEAGTRVMSVEVRGGRLVDSVQITHARPDGSLLALPQHGEYGGNEQTFVFAQGEYITSIEGKYGDFVDSITIRTNLGNTVAMGGWGGGDGGEAVYRYEVPGFEIVGFLGRSGRVVDAIGVVLREL